MILPSFFKERNSSFSKPCVAKWISSELYYSQPAGRWYIYRHIHITFMALWFQQFADKHSDYFLPGCISPWAEHEHFVAAHFVDKLRCPAFDAVVHPSQFVKSGSNFQMKVHFAEHLFLLWNCFTNVWWIGSFQPRRLFRFFFFSSKRWWKMFACWRGTTCFWSEGWLTCTA